MTVNEIDYECCPMCGSDSAVWDSEPGPNLYSEKLALLLDRDERSLLREHANWRCARCGLLYKRRWFPESTIRELFSSAVAVHPRGWDAVLNRFSAAGFRKTVDEWEMAVASGSADAIRRGQRELVSIIESITQPEGFESAALSAAIAACDTAKVRASCAAVSASIAEPAPFKRFTGFRSRDLWDYLRGVVGALDNYAEVGCPLWGLLPLAAQDGLRATFLQRDEPNYWGRRCVHGDQWCLTRLLLDQGVSAAEWSAPQKHSMIGVFQYLDHMTDPRGFLEELFTKAHSAAVIVDALDSPLAIQHLTGWTTTSMHYAADLFGKHLHSDYAPIRPSGNVLYVLSGVCER